MVNDSYRDDFGAVTHRSIRRTIDPKQALGLLFAVRFVIRFAFISAESRYVAPSHAHDDVANEGFGQDRVDENVPDRKDVGFAAGAGFPVDVSDGVTGVFCGVYDRCGAGVSLTTLANGTSEYIHEDCWR
jgi:hypothetical protein